MNKRIVLSVTILAVLVGGFFVFNQWVKPALQNRTVATVVPMKISGQNFSFTYPSGQDAYTLIEPPVEASETGLTDAYIIMNNTDYLNFQADESAETPPTVTIFVASAPSGDEVEGNRTERILYWATSHPEFSSFDTKTSEIEMLEIDGIQAIHYKAEGSYSQSIYLMNYQGNIYTLIGQYEKETDDIAQMFNDLVDTIAFD